MAEVEVGLGPVLGHEHLAVLERAHRARVDVDVGIELLERDRQAARDQQVADGGGGDALAECGDDTAGDEDEACLRAAGAIGHSTLEGQCTRAARRDSVGGAPVDYGRREQLLGMPPGARVARIGSEHAAELLHDRALLDPLDAGSGDLPAGGLLDPEVALRERGDLRQVGDAEHLALLAEAAQPFAHRARRLASDTGVDLVEHERGGSAGARHGEKRKHHARQLAAGRGVADRRGGHPAVGGQHQLDPLGTPGAEILALLDGDFEAGVLEGQRPQLLEHLLREPRRGLAPAGAYPLGEPAALRRGLGERRLRLLAPQLGALETLALRAAVLGVLQHRGDAAAVLALQPVVAVQALLDLLEAPGLRLERLVVAAQLASEVLGLETQRPHALRQAVERRIDAGHPLGQPLGLREHDRRPGGVALRAPAPRPPPRRRNAGHRAAAGAPARPAAPAPRPRSARSSSISSISNRSRSRSRSRVPARSRSSSSSRPSSRTSEWALASSPSSSRCSGPQKPSSSWRWAEATVSRRCSCWPKNATSRLAELAQVGRRGRPALHEGAGASLRGDAAREDDLLREVHALPQVGQGLVLE